VAEIILGIILFNSVITRQPDWFPFLKEIGLIYLMFIAGMELNVKVMMREGKFLWYVVLPLISFAVLPAIFVRLGHPFYIGIIVSVMSAGIVIPVLKESRLMKTPVGAMAVGATLTGEFLSIAAITGIDIYLQHGLTFMALVSAVKIVMLGVAAVLFLKMMYLIAWWTPNKVKRVMESEDPVEEGIRAIIFIAFTGALLAYYAGVEPILGSFMGGLIFGNVFRSKGMFEDKINAVGFGFFIPMFFIGVGADFDLSFLHSASAVLFALFLTLMVFASRLPQLLQLLAGKTGTMEAFAATFLMSAPLTMMIVAGTVGFRTGLIGRDVLDAVVLASVLSGIVYPSLFRPLGRRILKKMAAEGNDRKERARAAAR